MVLPEAMVTRGNGDARGAPRFVAAEIELA